jgi:hypothetical protein
MKQSPALMMAISLQLMPAQVRLMRKQPLPDGMGHVLRIVGGDDKALAQAVAVSGRSREMVCEASAFFIEQMLLYPGADSYRVLGARPDASNDELRRNMALLLRWLHPDVANQTARALFAQRVTRAWNDLKSPERRTAYDRSRPIQKPKQRVPSKKGRSRSNARVGHRQPVRLPARRMGLWDRIILLISGRFVP